MPHVKEEEEDRKIHPWLSVMDERPFVMPGQPSGERQMGPCPKRRRMYIKEEPQ
jgi:hypothetical protein